MSKLIMAIIRLLVAELNHTHFAEESQTVGISIMVEIIIFSIVGG